LEKSEKDNPSSQQRFSEDVRIREQRKIRSRKEENRNVWFGLGMFGVVGWSVAIPTLIAIFVGVWIDVTWKSPYSWTLMLLFVGIVVGCINAWFWIKREQRNIFSDRESDEDLK